MARRRRRRSSKLRTQRGSLRKGIYARNQLTGERM